MYVYIYIYIYILAPVPAPNDTLRKVTPYPERL